MTAKYGYSLSFIPSDNIQSRILKECADTIAPALSCIFSRSVQTGQLPSDWSTANISSVFKKGDMSKAENYRPISLTSVACKLLEHIICRHLRDHREKHNILGDRNHGFRSGYSCETQLLTTDHAWPLQIQRRRNPDWCGDLGLQQGLRHSPPQQAPTQAGSLRCPRSCPHMDNKLLDKPQDEGSPGGWKVRTEAAVDSGVPQSTVKLGPLLFLCHINDLPETVKSTVRLFADDCLLYREIRSFEDHLLLQEDLHRLKKGHEV